MKQDCDSEVFSRTRFELLRYLVPVLVLIREKNADPFTTEELKLLRNVQIVLQGFLDSMNVASPGNGRETLRRSFRLTEREVDVIELLITGARNKAIAKNLNLSVTTIKTHLHHIFRKMNVSSRTALSCKARDYLPVRQSLNRH